MVNVVELIERKHSFDNKYVSSLNLFTFFKHLFVNLRARVAVLIFHKTPYCVNASAKFAYFRGFYLHGASCIILSKRTIKEIEEVGKTNEMFHSINYAQLHKEIESNNV